MLLDTTILIEITRSDKDTKRFDKIFQFIEEEPLYISMIQIAEVADWCQRNDVRPSEFISQIKNIANVIPLDEDICIDGSNIKSEMRDKKISKFSLLDGIILASARSIDEKLLTTDSDFRKADDAIVIN